ncbi:MAG: hypothetical protein IKV03_03860 [Alphaproteobacteria bacterium]|nr:hypothetical protein [Alphaproteobacteria bacterium]
MGKFSEQFLYEVSKYALSHDKLDCMQGELSSQLFQKKIYQLQQNVHLSAELTSIFFECGYSRMPQKESKVDLEKERLKRLKEGLILMSHVPAGRELLSHMPLDIYMYAMIQEDRGFFSSSDKMLSVSSRHPTLWVGKKLYIKTLAHEMAHARHNQAFSCCEYGFSPKAFFIEAVFDELGARLTGEKIYHELCKSGKINGEENHKPLSISRLVDIMEKNGYFSYFAQEISDKIGRDMNMILDEDDTLNQPLGEMFSYYMKLYPQLRQKNVLDKIDAQYRKLILYPAGRLVGLSQSQVNRRFKDFGYGK